jgi:hypothetical protein
MHILGFFEIVIQIYFAIHAGRTGRYWWIFIILAFPLVGSIIYFFAEYLPEMQMAARISKPRGSRKKKNIKSHQRELEITDSIQNRINLAKAYYHNSQCNNAISLLEESLTGGYANNINIIEGLCLSYFKNENYPKTKEYLFKLQDINNDKLPNNLSIIKAQTHEFLGEDEQALDAYKSIVNSCTGEEARCRYALMLKKVGQFDEANELFGEILKNARLYPKQYKKFHKEWVRIAKNELN